MYCSETVIIYSFDKLQLTKLRNSAINTIIFLLLYILLFFKISFSAFIFPYNPAFSHLHIFRINLHFKTLYLYTYPTIYYTEIYFRTVIYRIVYKQLSADIKMHNHNIKTSFVSPDIPKARANKTVLNIMIIHLYINRNLDMILCDI